MTCRAPTTATTCTCAPTGATLSYDTQGRLTGWSGGTVTDSFLYDGAGNRVAQQVTVNGTSTTTTTYVDGGQEEVATSGSSSTLTKYLPGKDGTPVAERIGTGGALTYLASDGQGSVSVALDSNGNSPFQQLYTPYGSVRYSNGASPTAFGYTGQRADAATGLDYYHARYYDPVAQQFVSADSVQQGLSRYAYVGGNPETATDPTGHRMCEFNHCGGCVHDCGGSGGGGCTSNCGGNPCTGNNCSGGIPPAVKKKPSPVDAALGKICGIAGVALCDYLKEKLSSYSPNDIGNALRTIGFWLIVAGVVISIVDIILILTNVFDPDKGRVIEAVLDIANAVVGLVGNATILPGTKPSFIYGAAAFFAMILGVGHTLLGYWKMGWLGQAAVTAGIDTTAAAAQSEGGPMLQVFMAMFRTAGSYVLGAIGSALISAGYGLATLGYDEQNS